MIVAEVKIREEATGGSGYWIDCVQSVRKSVAARGGERGKIFTAWENISESGGLWRRGSVGTFVERGKVWQG